MEFSFLRALAASVRNQVSSQKSQSKRLQAASFRVFGVEYTIEVCRDAVAAANGHRNWGEVMRLSSFTGQDRSQPAWHIRSRNDLHESCLKALYETDSETCYGRSVVVLGSVEDASIPAIVLWAEQISGTKVPGIIIIDTKEPTYQKTPIGQAAKALGLAGTFQDFRVIDTRSPSIALSLTGSINDWIESLYSGLSKEDWKVLSESKALVRLERIMYLLVAIGGYADKENPMPDSSVLARAVHLLLNPGGLDPLLYQLGEGDKSKYWFEPLQINISHPEKSFTFPKNEINRLSDLVKEISHVAVGHGIQLRYETRHRPAIVLCDTSQPVSMSVATFIRDMYLNRNREEPRRGLERPQVCPSLFCSTQNIDMVPPVVRTYEQSIIVTGESDIRASAWESPYTKSALFVEAKKDGIVVSGKFAEIENPRRTPQLGE